jgi:hypothetical protein
MYQRHFMKSDSMLEISNKHLLNSARHLTSEIHTKFQPKGWTAWLILKTSHVRFFFLQITAQYSVNISFLQVRQPSYFLRSWTNGMYLRLTICVKGDYTCRLLVSITGDRPPMKWMKGNSRQWISLRTNPFGDSPFAGPRLLVESWCIAQFDLCSKVCQSSRISLIF